MEPLIFPGTWALLILLGVMLLAGAAIAVVAGARAKVRPDPDRMPTCSACGYLTVGLRSDRCPECGANLPTAQAARPNANADLPPLM